MRKSILVLIAILAVLIFGLAYSSSQAQNKERSGQEKEALKGLSAPLPSSLDALYPPKAEQPIFLSRMMEMATPLVGIVVDLFEDDLQNAKNNFERFKAQYVDVSKLVPEWRKDYPTTPVEELGEALRKGDQDEVMAAYENVSNICHDCHLVNMVKVQQKFHWQDFRTIKVKDPLTDEQVDFRLLMQYLITNFIGISVDTMEDQKENAQKQFQGFKARFQAMKDTCEECHATEKRKYYVDESVQAMVDEMGKALNKPSVDPKEVEKLAQGIGMESCFKCHWVHLPAAYVKYQWEKWENIKGNNKIEGQGGDYMSAEENKAIIRRAYDECFNKGNLAISEEIISTDFISRTPHPGGLPPDLEGFKQVVAMLRAAFPDLHFTVEDMIAEGNKVVARVTVRGTHKGEFMGIVPTGKQVTITGIDIFRMEGGKAVERWGEFDMLGLMQQLDVVPPPRKAGQ